MTNIRPDNRLDDMPMMPVSCHACAAEVLVRKSSWEQTSVQWTAEAIARCPQRRDALALPAAGRPAVFLSCSALGESILAAARRGQLPIVVDDDASHHEIHCH